MTADSLPRPRRQRLQTIETDFAPFCRAQLDDISLYWIPVRSFPLPFQQRRWLLQFFVRLKNHLAQTQQLRVETFLQLKYLQEGLHERFTEMLFDYHPTTGLAVTPGASLPAPPTSSNVKELIDNTPPGRDLDLNHLAPDYSCWFVKKRDEQQRNDFFGVGGTITLFLPPDPGAAPPKIEMPKILRTHPAFKGQDVEGTLQTAFALKDGFLAKSKEVFGAHLPESARRHMPFILPLLASSDFFRATPADRAKWFDVFHGYAIESPRDQGVLFAFKEREFDPQLVELVTAMRDQKLEYSQ